MDWFPKLPSYQAFSNRLIPAFQVLAEYWLGLIGIDLQGEMEYIVDSCPIILAKGPRSRRARITLELCEKSYNSSRKEWYYGIKLHAAVARKPGRLPIPLSLIASGATQHDLPAAKQVMENHFSLKPGKLYADKAYIDADLEESLKKDHALELLTPRKKRKGDPFVSGDTFSIFVSSLRQPIECFFNWLNRLTNLQSVSAVRSLSGLLFHVFSRIAVALVSLIFNS